jgi:hypothetical protein
VIDPYANLPQSVLDQVDRLTKSASRLTLGMIVSIFIWAGFLFVIGFSILRIVQARKLCWQFPILVAPGSAFPGKTKKGIATLAITMPNLDKMITFSAARKTYWIAVVLAGVMLFLLLV